MTSRARPQFDRPMARIRTSAITCIPSPTPSRSPRRAAAASSSRPTAPGSSDSEGNAHSRRHGRPVVRQRGLRPQGAGRRRPIRQMLELPYYNTFFKTATPPSIELAEKLAELTPDGPGARLLRVLGLGGQRHHRADGPPLLEPAGQGRRRRPSSAASYAYHGSTMAATSLGGMAAMHEPGGPAPARLRPRHAAPYWYDFGGDLSREQFGIMAANGRSRTRSSSWAPETVAAFIGEPIHGRRVPCIVPPESYWPEVQRICRKHDVLLIADEVICGLRAHLGHWTGSELYGLEPDIMTHGQGPHLGLSAAVGGPGRRPGRRAR